MGSEKDIMIGLLVSNAFKNGSWIYIIVKTNRFGDEGNVFSLKSLVKSKQCHLLDFNFLFLTCLQMIITVVNIQYLYTT